MTAYRRGCRLEGGPTHPPGECKDYNDNCQNWAIMGECTKNAPYMVGADGSEGECKAACKAC
jgi:prolyl 4-hydroxylase